MNQMISKSADELLNAIQNQDSLKNMLIEIKVNKILKTQESN